MMLFGMERIRGRPARRGGLLSGVGVMEAGRLALRWWRNRRASSPGKEVRGRERDHNPIHGWK